VYPAHLEISLRASHYVVDINSCVSRVYSIEVQQCYVMYAEQFSKISSPDLPIRSSFEAIQMHYAMIASEE